MKLLALLLISLSFGCRHEGRSAEQFERSGPDLSHCPDDRVAGVGGADEAPVLLERVDPDFSESAGVSGVLIIETVISRNGDVCAARVLRGLTPAIDAAALTAVRQWRFTPAKKSGQPVQAAYNISVTVP